jgi:transposase
MVCGALTAARKQIRPAGNFFGALGVIVGMSTSSGFDFSSVPLSVLEGLVVQLQSENARLLEFDEQVRLENAHLREQITMLTAVVQELQARIAKDSHNSSKPPSSDGLRKKPAPKSQRPKTGKRSGGQPGHRGSTLRMQDEPTHIVDHAPEACTDCGASLVDVPAAQDFERRQVFDLPKHMALESTEHRALRKVCPGCGVVHDGKFPASVAQLVQYGERIRAMGVYLTCYQLLPWDRTTQMLADMFGASLCEGTLQKAQEDCKNVVTPICEQIKQAITEGEYAFFDETGQRIAGKLHWLHAACTPYLTYYSTQAKRGRVATDAIGILTSFMGRASHDGWMPYQGYPCKHALCNAHHIRELDFLREQYGQIWAARMKALLLNIKKQVEKAKDAGLHALTQEAVGEFEARYDEMIRQGYVANPKVVTSGNRGRTKQTPGYNLVRRLEKRDQVLAFLYDFNVPFDNNQAERDLRMMKVKQKVSGCFRTLDGAHTFNTIRGYLSTMRKQGHNMLRSLETVFQGNPKLPGYT